MSLAELTSFEQLVGLMMQKDMISPRVIHRLWGIFANKKNESNPIRKRAALIVLSMLGKANKAIISGNLELLRQIGLQQDLILARYACVAFQQLGTFKKEKGKIAGTAGFTRLPMNHPIFDNLRDLMLRPTTSMEWFPFAEQAVNTVYLLSESPDALCGTLLDTFAQRVFPSDEQMIQDDSISVIELAKLCFLVGHVAIKQTAHLEVIESEWKRRKANEEKSRTAGDMEQISGTVEDEFAEAIALIREKEILFGSQSKLARFAGVVSFVCKNNLVFQVPCPGLQRQNPVLQTMAVLALCKLMCVSGEFCEDNLQLLFTILEKSQDAVIRSNTIIGLGDMTVSFNSLIDQNISYLYNRLQDTDKVVQKNTLMVLSHLVLNGMVKVKGQISEMAKCLEDPDQRISDLAKLFFTELSTKDNAVYNNLPDIISNLSHPVQGVAEDKFRTIMKFLLAFIKKEKQSENIVEKLCLRFRTADGERQWRDIAFCLSLMPFGSDKAIKKLGETLVHYQDKLGEPFVYKCFDDILNRIKKGLKSADMKMFVEEYEERIRKLHGKALGEHVDEEMDEAEQGEENVGPSNKPAPVGKSKAAKGGNKGKGNLEDSLAALSLKPKQRARKTRAKAKESSSEPDFSEEEEEEEEKSGDEVLFVAQPKATAKKPTRGRVTRGTRRVVVEEESD